MGPAAQLSFQFEFWAGSGPCLCVHAIWLLLCMQEPSFVCCMKPLCFSLGLVFPQSRRSPFEHSCSPWIVLSLIHALPVPPAFLPRLRGIPKELEGRDGASSCLVSAEKGPGVWGKPEGAAGKGFQPQSLPGQPEVNVMAAFSHCCEISLAMPLP